MLYQSDKIIRWGIPGWILLSWFLLIYTITHQEEVWSFVTNEAFKSLGITAVLASVGVPIGYIIHEVYFALFWTKRNINLRNITNKIDDFPKPHNWESMNDKEKFYYLEFLWDKNINEQHELVLNSIKERYRDRLTLIHSLGTLLSSMVCTIIGTIIWSFFGLQFTFLTLILLIIQCGIFWMIWTNYIYHSNNLLHYQGYYLNEMINKSD
ncbi:hypothetical protein GLW04_17235 [Halobacillus litoralis]|uniref:Uncharacterized protein n=1 Tax=Halobacillus litoralis TaxID=45668 RepID=A0A845DVF6_9BACI|nr:hypothetical protein [Halobacillus litoralis]MYL21651.1 hypothetical protein [Halobacillus litoralis]